MAGRVLSFLVIASGVMAQLDIEGHKLLLQKQNQTSSEAKSRKSLEEFQFFNAVEEMKTTGEDPQDSNHPKNISTRIETENDKPEENELQERQDILKTPEDLDNTIILYSSQFSTSMKDGSDPIDRISQVPNYNLRGQEQAAKIRTNQNLLQFQPLQDILTPVNSYSPSYYQAPNQQAPLYNNLQPLPSAAQVPYSAYQQTLPDHQLQGTANYPLYQTLPQSYQGAYYPSQQYRSEPLLPFGQLYPQTDYLAPVAYDQDVSKIVNLCFQDAFLSCLIFNIFENLASNIQINTHLAFIMTFVDYIHPLLNIINSNLTNLPF